MIRTRFATADDRDRLVDFVREHWIATHVFTDRPDLLDWQHLDGDGRLNFVLAEDDDGTVLGILGFIPLGHFDPALGTRDITLAIWKVRDVGVPPGVGLNLLKHLKNRLAPRLIAAIGTSEMVRPLYKALRYTVGTMQHHALFAPRDERATVIASGVPAAAFAAAAPDDGVELRPLTSTAPAELRDTVDRLAGDAVPAKSWAYVRTRYLEHPWYRYELRAVHVDGVAVAVVVWRAVAAESATVLRIVDVVGDTAWLARACAALQHEVAAAGAEYVDLVEWGVDPAHLDDLWVSPATTAGLVLPNYFSPFERRNIEIGMAVRVFDDEPPGRTVHLYRADSDQDRPNRVTELGGIVNEPRFGTEQEQFWAGEFGSDYVRRNQSAQLLASNLAFFTKALRGTRDIGSCIEFGANIGMNLRAISALLPEVELHAIEINPDAAAALRAALPECTVFQDSFIEWDAERTYDLVLAKGVLIHVNPDALPAVYDNLVAAVSRFLLVAEYYNPSPVSIPYRGHSERLFKRDFAGEILDRHPDFALRDYGFAYHRDPTFPQDDITWFLLERVPTGTVG